MDSGELGTPYPFTIFALHALWTSWLDPEWTVGSGMSYGYLHRGLVLEYDATTGGYVVEIPTLGAGKRMGPFPSAVPNLPEGERVILGSLGSSRDEMLIIGRIPGVEPTIGEIPGLQAALDAKADDTEITVLDGRLDVIEPIVSAHTTQIAGKISSSVIGQPGGVASLDGTGKHPSGELNAGVELISRKNAASGYAGLDASSKLTGSQQVYSTSTAAVANTGSAGAANTASRGDHVHALPVVAQRTVWLVQREDNATLATATSATRVTIHSAAVTGLTENTVYRIDIKVPAYCTVTGAKMRISLHKTSSANPTLDDSTVEVQSVGTDDVHGLRLTYYYKTLAAETSVTFIVSGYRYAGTGNVVFVAFSGMPYTFEMTQVGTGYSTF